MYNRNDLKIVTPFKIRNHLRSYSGWCFIGITLSGYINNSPKPTFLKTKTIFVAVTAVI